MLHVNDGWLSGNLTKDPEIEIIPDTGNSLLKLQMAFTHPYDVYNRKIKPFDKKSCFVTVRCWKRTAESAVKNLTKGDEILVNYSLIMDSWQDKVTKERKYMTLLELKPLGLRYVRVKKLGIGFDEPSKRGQYGDQAGEDKGNAGNPFPQ